MSGKKKLVNSKKKFEIRKSHVILNEVSLEQFMRHSWRFSTRHENIRLNDEFYSVIMFDENDEFYSVITNRKTVILYEKLCLVLV